MQNILVFSTLTSQFLLGCAELFKKIQIRELIIYRHRHAILSAIYHKCKLCKLNCRVNYYHRYLKLNYSLFEATKFITRL